MRNYQDELMQLARQVAAHYAEKPGMEAILLTGSVAKGAGDRASDIDLMLYYRELPPPAVLEQEKETAVATGGGIYSFNPEEGLACYRFWDGVRVDLAHQRRSELAAMIEAFVAEPSVDDATHHIIMSGIQQGVPLFGEPLLREWQAQLAALPPTFGQALVERHLRFRPRAVLQEMGVARGDLGLVYELLLEAMPNILNVLCGLNGRIPPGKIKGMGEVLAGLPLAPPRMVERMERLWRMDAETAVSHLYDIINDLIDLVAIQMPTVDTERVRRHIQIQMRLTG